MNTMASISYFLSERGRRESLRKGGDGKRQQTASDLPDPADLEFFAVDQDGHVSFDATTAAEQFEEDDKRRCSLVTTRSGSRIEVEWHLIPTWDDLLRFARWTHKLREQQDADMFLDWELTQAEQARIAHEFLADPSARADKLSEDYVTIGGFDFWSSTDAVVVEARARALRDQEELKKANRATLAEWTARHGTENQRERLIAGLLPWKEVSDAAEEHLYAPLASFQLYKRFEIDEVCECLMGGAEQPCKVKFQSVDAVELTAQEWEQFSKIRKVASQATFQLREHRAQCQIGFGPKIRRGVIVKMPLGQLIFKREFALTEGAV